MVPDTENQLFMTMLLILEPRTLPRSIAPLVLQQKSPLNINSSQTVRLKQIIYNFTKSPIFLNITTKFCLRFLGDLTMIKFVTEKNEYWYLFIWTNNQSNKEYYHPISCSYQQIFCMTTHEQHVCKINVFNMKYD